jgi:hypothetical protein
VEHIRFLVFLFLVLRIEYLVINREVSAKSLLELHSDNILPLLMNRCENLKCDESR